MRRLCLFPLLVLLAAGPAPEVAAQAAQPAPRVLVFSKTAGYRHASIPAGVEAVRRLGAAHGFGVDATEDAAVFASDSLGRYAAIVFMNTNGDVLAPAEEAAFEAYVAAGGGFVGVHSAAATEYDWEWYGRLVGAHFKDHPEPQPADVLVLDRAHPATAHLPARWHRFDEWYNYRWHPRGRVHVLAALDAGSYEGGTMGHDHPIAWAHEALGGRAFYTGLGHTEEAYADADFLRHLLGGLRWAMGLAEGDAGAGRAGSFEKVVLTGHVTDPMELGIAPDGRVFIAERSGPVKVWEPETGQARLAGYIPVNMTVEDGLLGLTLDPAFDENGWLYVYYSPADGGPQRLSRLTWDGEHVDPASEKVLLEVPVQRTSCCHSGGSLTFGPDGHLFLSTGDNSNPYPLGGSPIDERPGKRAGDAQRTSANTMDLRGKILRITPRADGTYAIPEGNLFADPSEGRPEIYIMGNRNPYRISVDPATGDLFWGDVGIGNAASEARGAAGWEEFNRARGPGFYGWPYAVGPNEPYRDFDYEAEAPGDFFDPEAPVNASPNNTGARVLPTAQPALIWYMYGPSEDFPALDAGGMSAMGGPVYRYDAATAAPTALPPSFDGAFFIYEWMRNWVKLVRFDDEGDVLAIEPFAPGLTFTRPMDLEVGPDGRLYAIEWGETFWGSNADARVVRLDYHGPAVAPDAAAPEVAAGAPTEAAPAVLIVWPPDGGVFDYGEPILYEVTAPEGAAGVEVQPLSGHDTHAHPLPALRGAAGTFVVTREPHVPDLHFTDRYGALEARLDGVPSAARVRLQPRLKEAEHATLNAGTVRKTYGKHPAEPDFAATALTVLLAEAGDHVAYAPVSLHGIDSLVFRLRPEGGGRMELRLDAPDGPLLGSVEVPAAAEVSEVATAAEPMHDLALADVDEDVREAYEGWMDVAVPVDGAGGAHALYLVFHAPEGASADSRPVLRLDRFEFRGPGIHQRLLGGE